MMRDDRIHHPQQLLAQRFSDHVVSWAEASGAPDDALSILRRVACGISEATTGGHACLSLSDMAGQGMPELAEIRRLLLASGVVGTPDDPGTMPLIIDNQQRLYLHRYFDYERRLAHRLLMASGTVQGSKVDVSLNPEVPFSAVNHSGQTLWQRVAVALALLQKLTIISGGPGTGKTSTVVHLLACLLEKDPECRIRLTAPTGKAAARMLEAIRQSAAQINAEVQSKLPTESFTIHRLLGVTSDNGRYRHHAGNPLAVDVLVVDEASMLDLALATRLFEAVPPHARIILLGDKDQLSAVEAGAVFSEICANPTLTPDCVSRLAVLTEIPEREIAPMPPTQLTPLSNSVIWFSENFRFAHDSGIGKLASEVNAGNADAVMSSLRNTDDRGITWIEDGNLIPAPLTLQMMFDRYAGYLHALQTSPNSLPAIFEAFDQFRVLCALREGSRGVNEINRQISRYFRNALNHPLDPGEQSEWYPGKPLMVLRNDYNLNLFNGDIGIALPDESGTMKVHFPDSMGGYRTIAPIRLAAHETAFAMTVHKSQGSEFDTIMLVLPAHESRAVSRELFYTAITRARNEGIVVGDQDVVEMAIASQSQRRSGLISRMAEMQS
jgi:exodeoxyribonuclease V alpha subunit